MHPGQRIYRCFPWWYSSIVTPNMRHESALLCLVESARHTCWRQGRAADVHQNGKMQVSETTSCSCRACQGTTSSFPPLSSSCCWPVCSHKWNNCGERIDPAAGCQQLLPSRRYIESLPVLQGLHAVSVLNSITCFLSALLICLLDMLAQCMELRAAVAVAEDFC